MAFLPDDNYLVRHEFAAGDRAKRAAYMDGKTTHQDYYIDIAQQMNLPWLTRLATAVADLQTLTKHRDDLNAIPLSKWDNMHAEVTRTAHANGWRVWTLSDTVCILKAVARHITAPVQETACESV